MKIIQLIETDTELILINIAIIDSFRRTLLYLLFDCLSWYKIVHVLSDRLFANVVGNTIIFLSRQTYDNFVSAEKRVLDVSCLIYIIDSQIQVDQNPKQIQA